MLCLRLDCVGAAAVVREEMAVLQKQVAALRCLLTESERPDAQVSWHCRKLPAT